MLSPRFPSLKRSKRAHHSGGVWTLQQCLATVRATFPMRSLLVSGAFCLALSALSAGCKPATDVGGPCFLTKRDRNTDAGVHIKEGELVGKVGVNKDFISFRSTECEDLVCVRDSTFGADP